MKIHIVQKGDTLWNLAQKYNVDFNELKSLNSQLSNPELIYPGMKIKIPSATTSMHSGSGYFVKEEPKPNVYPIKEQPMKEMKSSIQEQAISVPKEQIENTYVTQPTQIHQDIYQIDMVTMVNQEQEMPEKQPKPMPVPPKQPVYQPIQPENKKKTPAVEDVHSVTEMKGEKCTSYQSEASCQPMPQMCLPTSAVMPQMPYPYLVPCMPMPSYWRPWFYPVSQMFPAASLPMIQENSYTAQTSCNTAGVCTSPSLSGESEISTMQSSSHLSNPTSNITPQLEQTMPVYPIWGNVSVQPSTPYFSSSIQNSGMSPYSGSSHLMQS